MPGAFDELTDALEGFATLKAMPAAMVTAMESGRIAAKAGVLEHFEDGKAPDGTPWPDLSMPRPGSAGSDSPLRDTDRLMGSIDTRSEDNAITVLTNRIGAGVQNYGATIVPVNVKFLTIPMTLKARRSGGARKFDGILHPVIAKDRQSGVLIDEDDVVQYFLTKKSVIPQREFLGFSAETQSIILEILADHYFRASGLMEGAAP